ncbi:MAG TPA: hypothetical protein VEL28_17415 [Candidatus Binatia bacterium]|nr:hypothetical protein [Candidatus Binatia bacterium]
MGGSATGGSARGGDAVGGSAVGGSATGGSAVGGSATGGSATAIGGTATSGSVTPGTATANVGRRRITASGDGGVSIHAEDSRARVNLGNHVLLVEGDRVIIDGSERAKLPASADAIQITLRDGRLTVRADQADVFSENLRAR